MPGKLKESPLIQSPDGKEIGGRLASIRAKRGLTQIQLAEMVGIDQRLISSYEVGRITISAEMLYRLAIALRASTDEILGLKKEDAETVALSLRFVKRLSVIELFPEAQKKRILRNLDEAIAYNAQNTDSEPQASENEEPAE